MAFVPVPKDLNKVKTKVALNLTKRQIICFGLGAAVGIPLYLGAKSVIGNSPALTVMIAVMLPFFFFGIYEKDGQPAEKILINLVRTKFFFKAKRTYTTQNFYEFLDMRKEQNFGKAKANCTKKKAAKCAKNQNRKSRK
jgi:hypothetical protein